MNKCGGLNINVFFFFSHFVPPSLLVVLPRTLLAPADVFGEFVLHTYIFLRVFYVLALVYHVIILETVHYKLSRPVASDV